MAGPTARSRYVRSVKAATCGVTKTLGCASSGVPARGGSGSQTSVAYPPSGPSSSATATRRRHRRGHRGRCSQRARRVEALTGDADRSAGRSLEPARRTVGSGRTTRPGRRAQPARRRCRGGRDQPTTCIPNAVPSIATRVPIAPSPTTPIVRPRSSAVSNPSRTAQAPAAVAVAIHTVSRARQRASIIACSDTAAAVTPGAVNDCRHRGHARPTRRCCPVPRRSGR